MNNFDWGLDIGRFFISFIINDDFFGLAIRIGKEYAESECCDVYHVTIQVGYGQVTIGITS
jgi:hypothetical protein